MVAILICISIKTVQIPFPHILVTPCSFLSFLLLLLWLFCWFSSFMVAILTDRKQDLNIAFICISFIVTDVQDFLYIYWTFVGILFFSFDKSGVNLATWSLDYLFIWCLFYNIFYFYVYDSFLFLYVSMCNARRCQERSLDSLKLKLQKAVRLHVGTRTRTQDLCKSSQPF